MQQWVDAIQSALGGTSAFPPQSLVEPNPAWKTNNQAPIGGMFDKVM